MNIILPDSTCTVLRQTATHVFVQWAAKNEFVIWKLTKTEDDRYAVYAGQYYTDQVQALKDFETIVGPVPPLKLADFREFTDDDWMGYAGACKFEDGSEPYICDPTPEWTVILSGNGVEIIQRDFDGEDLRIWSDRFNFGEQPAANRLMFYGLMEQVRLDGHFLDNVAWLEVIYGDAEFEKPAKK